MDTPPHMPNPFPLCPPEGCDSHTWTQMLKSSPGCCLWESGLVAASPRLCYWWVWDPQHLSQKLNPKGRLGSLTVHETLESSGL